MREPKAIGAFERNLTWWVAGCIVAGIGVGQLLPGLAQSIGSMKVAEVNVPVGVNNVPSSERLVGSNLAVFARACSIETEGMACGDADECNGVETCSAGTCQPGTAPNCDDGNICTNDGCLAASGCTHSNNAVSCSDGLYCNGLEVCGGGICGPGVTVHCDDGVPCTADTCNEATDACEHAPCTVGVSAEGSSRMSQWWVHSISAVDRASPVIARHTVRAAELGATRGAFSAALATRFYRSVRSLLVRLRAGSQPHTAAEVLAYARSIERDMPNLAAELRFIALRGPEATKVDPHE